VGGTSCYEDDENSGSICVHDSWQTVASWPMPNIVQIDSSGLNMWTIKSIWWPHSLLAHCVLHNITFFHAKSCTSVLYICCLWSCYCVDVITMHVRFSCALINYTALFKYLFAYFLIFTHMLRPIQCDHEWPL